jgi:hypothetical protein
MTRAELMSVLTKEGRLSSPSRQTFVHRKCPYIKADVQFAPVSAGQFSPDDKIVQISRPYLDWSHKD